MDLDYGGFPYSYGFYNPYTWNNYYAYNGFGGYYGDYYGGFYPGYYGAMEVIMVDIMVVSALTILRMITTHGAVILIAV